MPSQNDEPEKVAEQIAPLLKTEKATLLEQLTKRASDRKIGSSWKEYYFRTSNRDTGEEY